MFDYLQAREQDRGVYREAWRTVTLADGGHRLGRSPILVNEHHPQYAGRLPLGRTGAAGDRPGAGESGPNTEYVRNTAQHLLALGIRDNALLEIVTALDGDECRADGRARSQQCRSSWERFGKSAFRRR